MNSMDIRERYRQISRELQVRAYMEIEKEIGWRLMERLLDRLHIMIVIGEDE